MRTSPNTVPARCGAEAPASRMSPKTLLTSSGARMPTISTGGRRAGREVGHQAVQLGGGHRRVGGVRPLTELVEVDPALPERRLQPGDHRLAVGVGGADDRGHVRGVGRPPSDAESDTVGPYPNRTARLPRTGPRVGLAGKVTVHRNSVPAGCRPAQVSP